MASEAVGVCLTELLQRYVGGDREGANALFEQITPMLRQLAAGQLKNERFVAPATPTELINEMWLRNLHGARWKITSRQHFYAIVSIAMRHVLIDLARKRLAGSRGFGKVPESLDHAHMLSIADTSDLEEIVHIDLLMERVEKKDPVGARIFEMHYFGGYRFEEIAEMTGMTVRQVRYRQKTAERRIKGYLVDQVPATGIARQDRHPNRWRLFRQT
jgi:RNA polymerase sigma factor (TIGR02999 family)